MTTRARIVEIAQGYVGSNDRVGFWQKALGYDPGKSKHWCGAFWLACIKEAGLTDIKWGIDGTGVQALRLPQTRKPQPGDLGYDDDPYQHHFLVETVGEHSYTSIDGNQGKPGVQRKTRAFKTPGITFYSIAKLLGEDEDTQPGPPRFPTLRLGATGEAVRRVQTKLNSHGAALKVDGQFGPATALAVQSFQRRANLDADGIVGARTWRALEST